MRWLAAICAALIGAGVSGCNDLESAARNSAAGSRLHTRGAAGGETAFDPAVRRIWSSPGAVGLGHHTPDGRHVVYTNWPTGELTVSDLAEGTVRVLTPKPDPGAGAFGEWPVVSRDGEYVAYVWFGEAWGHDLRVIPFDGGTPRILFKPSGAYPRPVAWAPDGRTLAVVLHGDDGAHQLALFDLAGGEPRVIKTFDWRFPRHVDFSPDGRFMAYDFAPVEGSRAHDIYVIASDGSRERAVVRSPEHHVLLGWEPSGQGILYGTDRRGSTEIRLLPVANGRATGAARLVKDGVWRMDPLGFARDGSFFYRVWTEVPDVFSATVDLATGRALSAPASVSGGQGSGNPGVTWSPDGQQVAYIVRGEAVVRAAEQQIVIKSLASGDQREIGTDLSYINRVAWQTDGSGLYVAGRDARNRRGLFRMDLASGKLTQINPPLDAQRGYFRGLTESPDGRRLYYIDINVGGEPAFVMYGFDLASGEETILRHPGPNRVITMLSLSFDGEWIAFGEHEHTHNASAVLKVMPSRGGEARELLRFEEDDAIGGITWTPDGRHIVIVRRRPGREDGLDELWAVPVAGGAPRPLHVAAKRIIAPRIHPDGRRIGFGAGSFAAELWVMEPVTSLAGAGVDE